MLTHNIDKAGPNSDVPVIIENPDTFPFGPGERAEWHETTEEEYASYVAYWEKLS